MEDLPKVVKKRSKRLGRGYGSGKGGHTSSRGQKGQKSRSKVHILFEGVKMKKSYIKRLPLRRGKGKFKSKSKPIVVKIDYLNTLRTGSVVDIEALVTSGIVKKSDAEAFGVKILGGGKLAKKLTIKVPISRSAAKQVESAGGKIAKSKKAEKSKNVKKKETNIKKTRKNKN